jgi:hypothetical protein
MRATKGVSYRQWIAIWQDFLGARGAWGPEELLGEPPRSLRTEPCWRSEWHGRAPGLANAVTRINVYDTTYDTCCTPMRMQRDAYPPTLQGMVEDAAELYAQLLEALAEEQVRTCAASDHVCCWPRASRRVRSSRVVLVQHLHASSEGALRAQRWLCHREGVSPSLSPRRASRRATTRMTCFESSSCTKTCTSWCRYDSKHTCAVQATAALPRRVVRIALRRVRLYRQGLSRASLSPTAPVLRSSKACALGSRLAMRRPAWLTMCVRTPKLGRPAPVVIADACARRLKTSTCLAGTPPRVARTPQSRQAFKELCSRASSAPGAQTPTGRRRGRCVRCGAPRAVAHAPLARQHVQPGRQPLRQLHHVRAHQYDATRALGHGERASQRAAGERTGWASACARQGALVCLAADAAARRIRLRC